MRLYIVTFKDDNCYWSESYLADDHDHAEEQCRDANPLDIEIINVSSIPFHMIERAYYLIKQQMIERR